MLLEDGRGGIFFLKYHLFTPIQRINLYKIPFIEEIEIWKEWICNFERKEKDDYMFEILGLQAFTYLKDYGILYF